MGRRRIYPLNGAFLTVYVHPDAHRAVKECARRHNVTMSDYVRAIITDAIVEEGFDERRFRSQGDTQGREGREASGATA